MGVSFSKDSKQLAANAIDGIIKVWDVDSQNCLHTYKESTDIPSNCWSINFNNEGKLISTYEDGSLRCLNVLKENVKK